MDNRIFNVNGEGFVFLKKVLNLAFEQRSERTTAKSYRVDRKKGLILRWWFEPEDSKRGVVPFPTDLTADEVAPVVWKWLKSEEASKTELTGWDAECDHDGDDEDGWRVFCEDWGHVADDSSAICAITPAVLWIGK